MLAKLSGFLDRVSSPRNLVILFGLLLVFVIVLFPWLVSLGGGGEAGMLDTRFSYTPGEAYAVIEQYGAQGRVAMILISLIADSVFPFVSTFTLAVALTLTFRRAFPAESLMQRLRLFPFGALVFDFLENFSLVALMLLYPSKYYGLARLANTFTSTKWILVGLSGILVLVGVAGMLFPRQGAQSE
jgi:hypothetical protein